MGIESHFIHTALIFSPVESTAPYGGGSVAGTIGVSTSARLVEKTERIWLSERAEAIAVTVYTLLLPSESTIGKEDLVVVASATFTVAGILARNARAPHHQSVSLEKVS